MCLRELKQGLCINLEGWNEEREGREVQEGENICIPVADSCWGLTENKILYSNYPSIKKKKLLQINKKKTKSFLMSKQLGRSQKKIYKMLIISLKSAQKFTH